MPTTTAVIEIVQVIGNPRTGSRTRGLADTVSRAIARHLGVTATTTVLELGELVGVTFDSTPTRGSGEVDDPFDAVRSARLLVVATPTYKATYSGLLKIFLDQLTQGDLADAVAVPVAIAGADEHRKSVAAALRELLVELGASVPAPAVAVLETELAERSADEVAAEWAGRYGDTLGLLETAGGHR